MNDSTNFPAPVVWPLVVAALGVFAIFLVIVNLARTPVTPLTAATNVPAEEQWKLTSEGRQARRVELQDTAQTAAHSYAWINREAGIVRLPVDRAVALTLRDINANR